MKRDYLLSEKQLFARLQHNDLVQAKYPVSSFLEEYENTCISSMRLFRLMMEDVFPLFAIEEFSQESGNAIYIKSQRTMFSTCSNGFLMVNRRDNMWFPAALIPLWIENCFEYKNYGIVNQLASSTKGLLSNLRVIQCALSNICFNRLSGPLSKKEKEIEIMYLQEYGYFFRKRTNTIQPEKEAEQLIRATNACGFHYCILLQDSTYD